MLNIYGHFFSTPSNKVRMTANALNLDYEFHLINLPEGQQRSEEYLKINPLGKVPCIDDDGFMLSESNAIVKYLCKKSHSVLYPDDLKQQALIDQLMDRCSLHIYQGIMKVVYNRMLKPMRGIEPDENEIAEGQEILDQQLPVVEEQLSNSTYLMGSELTLADITLINALDPADAVKVDLSDYKNIGAWRDYIMKQEFYLKVHAFFGEEMKK